MLLGAEDPLLSLGSRGQGSGGGAGQGQLGRLGHTAVTSGVWEGIVQGYKSRDSQTGPSCGPRVTKTSQEHPRELSHMPGTHGRR